MKALRHLALLTLFSVPALAEEEKSVPDVALDQVRWGEVVNEVEFDKESLEGKVVVVEEWGVRCPPCIASLPDLAKMARRYARKGLVVIGLEQQGSSKEQILEVIKKPRVKYAVMSGGRVPVPSNGIPHASVFDHNGKLLWHGNPHDEEFEDAVKDALKAIPKA